MALAEITQPLFYAVAVINVLLGLAALLVLAAWITKPPFWNKLHKHFNKHGVLYGFSVALLATAGSLWLSEIAGITPCLMCWYQRVAMYPLVVVLGAGLYKQTKPRLPGLILSITGLVIASYHYLVQRANFWQVDNLNPAQQAITSFFEFFGLTLQAPGCAVDASCSVMHLGYWGFYSIPLLALVSFFAITVALLLYKQN